MKFAHTPHKLFVVRMRRGKHRVELWLERVDINSCFLVRFYFPQRHD